MNLIDNLKFKINNWKKLILLCFVFSFCIINFALFISPTYAAGSSLSLSPASGTFNKGCTFALDVVLDTGGSQVAGVDAIIFYDPTRFSAAGIRSGTIFSDYPGNIIDTQVGRISISGVASAASPYNGQGTLASLDFKVLDNAPTGAVQMKFDFDPTDKTKTNDSNVAEFNTVADILDQVTDGNYTVGSGSSCASGSGGKGGVSTGSGTIVQPIVIKTPPQKELSQTADFQTTFVIAAVGTILTILGIVGLAVL